MNERGARAHANVCVPVNHTRTFVRTQVAVSRKRASSKAPGSCTGAVPTPAPSAPFSVISSNQRMAESQRVSGRRRQLSASPADVDACYVKCTAYAGGIVPFFFEVQEATGACSCCMGVCTAIYAAGTTVRPPGWHIRAWLGSTRRRKATQTRD